MTTTEAAVLAALRACQGSREEAARRSGVAPQHVSLVVKRLRAQGYVVPANEKPVTGKAEYVPTLAEIESACAMFQRAWGPEGRRQRAVQSAGPCTVLRARSVGRRGRERVYEME